MPDQPQTPQPAAESQPQNRPNEQGSISVEGFIRIYDPNNHRVYLESRA